MAHGSFWNLSFLSVRKQGILLSFLGCFFHFYFHLSSCLLFPLLNFGLTSSCFSSVGGPTVEGCCGKPLFAPALQTLLQTSCTHTPLERAKPLHFKCCFHLAPLSIFLKSSSLPLLLNRFQSVLWLLVACLHLLYFGT